MSKNLNDLMSVVEERSDQNIWRECSGCLKNKRISVIKYGFVSKTLKELVETPFRKTGVFLVTDIRKHEKIVLFLKFETFLFFSRIICQYEIKRGGETWVYFLY
ncbi:hypothetical protein [Bacillus sp. USDA818B3_A]|uniref:hypothetical protein n=1 Tax=Bacillus sp. USDA818B3_A TaxID=2698834 RepID=UPI00136A893A|nr:hypothetical protein [Bacillus sp. USDA818B3_A]